VNGVLAMAARSSARSAQGSLSTGRKPVISKKICTAEAACQGTPATAFAPPKVGLRTLNNPLAEAYISDHEQTQFLTVAALCLKVGLADAVPKGLQYYTLAMTSLHKSSVLLFTSTQPQTSQNYMHIYYVFLR
jgi:hypothetical protein